MFSSLRIQIIYPCKAQCRWCGTWKKNSNFMDLYNDGITEQVHQYYKDMIVACNPRFLFISGGEPLLYPGIFAFIAEIAEFVKSKIYLYTSYQYPLTAISGLGNQNIPWDKIILTHTTAGFNKSKWDDMTNFPFETYTQNIKTLAEYPWQKLVKFIINHENVENEINQFVDTIQPDQSFLAKFKFLNNQSGDFGKNKIADSKQRAIAELSNEKLFAQSNLKFENEISGKEIINSFLYNEEDINCIYRKTADELRFAFYKSNSNGIKLKYRFCPFFPSEKHFIFKLGRDSFEDVQQNFYSKRWYNWCRNCRLRLYTTKED